MGWSKARPVAPSQPLASRPCTPAGTLTPLLDLQTREGRRRHEIAPARKNKKAGIEMKGDKQKPTKQAKAIRGGTQCADGGGGLQHSTASPHHIGSSRALDNISLQNKRLITYATTPIFVLFFEAFPGFLFVSFSCLPTSFFDLAPCNAPFLPVHAKGTPSCCCTTMDKTGGKLKKNDKQAIAGAERQDVGKVGPEAIRNRQPL